MFLAMGPFPHAAMWALWFQQAGGLLPADCVASAACGAAPGAGQARALASVMRACGPSHRPPGAPLLGPPTRMSSCLDAVHAEGVVPSPHSADTLGCAAGCSL
jgi:hypothetical protein